MWKDGVGNDIYETLDPSKKVTIDGKSCFVSKSFNPCNHDRFTFQRRNPEDSTTWNETSILSYGYYIDNGPYNYYSIDGWDGNNNWHSYTL